MKKVYLLTSKKLEGVIRVSFVDGIFNGIETEIKEPLKYEQFAALMNRTPFLEADIDQYKVLGFDIDIEFATNEKIALFCEFYEKRVGIKYKVSAADSGKIKGVKIDNDILNHYFFVSSNFFFLKRYSIANLVKYYNELRAEIAALGKSSHPSYYSKEYETKLQPGEVAGYWAHLRSLGLKPKKNRVGVTIDWV